MYVHLIYSEILCDYVTESFGRGVLFLATHAYWMNIIEHYSSSTSYINIYKDNSIFIIIIVIVIIIFTHVLMMTIIILLLLYPIEAIGIVHAIKAASAPKSFDGKNDN